MNEMTVNVAPLWKKAWAMALLLVGAAIVAELPAARGTFQWDDEELHISKVAAADSPWKFFSLGAQAAGHGAQGNYYPLSMLGFWVEYQFFGRETIGYHVVNLLLHGGNVLLAWLLLRRLKVPWAWTVALVFAIHPMVVESVAYISELKNLLSGVFYLAAAHLWLTWADGGKKHGWYAAMAACFIAAMLAKSVACTFPIAMVILEYWRRGRIDRRAVLGAIPLAVIGTLIAVRFVMTEQGEVGAQGAAFHFSLIERLLIAGRALWFYAGKFLWPWPLLTVYPRWETGAAEWWNDVLAIAAAGALGGLWAMRRKIGLGAFAAALLFVVVVSPSLGLIVYYPMLFTFVADHYLYLAMIPLAAGYVGLIAWALKNVRHAEWIVAAAVGIVLFAATWNQAARWQTPVTLWEPTAAGNPGSWYVFANLAYAYVESEHFTEARQFATKSLALKKDNSRAHFTLARADLALNDNQGAVNEYSSGLALEPMNAVAWSNDGLALEKVGSLPEAERAYETSVELNGAQPKVWNEIAVLRLRRGAWADAETAASCAVELSPAYGIAYVNLGLALEKQEKWEKSAASLERGIQLMPPNVRIEEELDRVRKMRAEAKTMGSANH